ncbi:MAG: sulfotransferase family protein [Prochloraceae cyanobacterium]
MTVKIIGAGMGRTGTMSLKTALEELGFDKCYHMIELVNNPERVNYWEVASEGKNIKWDKLLQGYQAIVDHPGCMYYQQLIEYYPEAKVILTVRDPEKWYESALNTIYQNSVSRKQNPPSEQTALNRVAEYIEKDIWQGDFNGKFEDKEYAIERFNQHIQEVKQNVPSENLLVYEVKQGWQPLCDFIGVSIPNKDFPHVNDRASFAKMVKEINSQS